MQVQNPETYLKNIDSKY